MNEEKALGIDEIITLPEKEKPQENLEKPAPQPKLNQEQEPPKNTQPQMEQRKPNIEQNFYEKQFGYRPKQLPITNDPYYPKPVRGLSRGTKRMFWTFGIIFLLLFAISIIWFNVNFNKKSFADQGDTINVQPAEVNVPIENTYNHEIINNITIQNNVTLIIPDSIIVKLENISS